jgi:hypothetical protein
MKSVLAVQGVWNVCNSTSNLMASPGGKIQCQSDHFFISLKQFLDILAILSQKFYQNGWLLTNCLEGPGTLPSIWELPIGSLSRSLRW